MEQAAEQLGRPLSRDEGESMSCEQVGEECIETDEDGECITWEEDYECESGGCRGLSLAELQELDWSLIDLSEWIDLMFEANLMPTDNTEEGLTGEGRTMNEGMRETVSYRTLERFGLMDEDDLERLEDEAREPLDCSQYPRPARCEYQTDN